MKREILQYGVEKLLLFLCVIDIDMFHSCEELFCTGSRFGGLCLFCKQCNEKIYLQCIDGTYAVQILSIIGMLKVKDDQTWLSPSPSNVSKLHKLFDRNSPFALTCFSCEKKQKINTIAQLISDKLVSAVQPVIMKLIENEMNNVKSNVPVVENSSDTSLGFLSGFLSKIQNQNQDSDVKKKKKKNQRKRKNKNKKLQKEKIMSDEKATAKQKTKQQQQKQQPKEQQNETSNQGVNTQSYQGVNQQRTKNVEFDNSKQQSTERDLNHRISVDRSFQRDNFVNYRRGNRNYDDNRGNGNDNKREWKHRENCWCHKCFENYERRYANFRRVRQERKPPAKQNHGKNNK